MKPEREIPIVTTPYFRKPSKILCEVVVSLSLNLPHGIAFYSSKNLDSSSTPG